MAASTSPLPRRTGRDRRRQLVQIAYHLIAERGLEGLRFGDVAHQAGINNGTLLYYFRTKDALVQAVVDFLVQQLSVSLVPRSADADPLAELRSEFEDVRVRLRRQPEISIVFAELVVRSQRDAAVATALRHMDATWSSWLRSLLQRGIDAGAVRADLDLGLVSTTIQALFRGVGLQAIATGDPAVVEPVVDALADLVERWVAAPDVTGITPQPRVGHSPTAGNLVKAVT